VSHTPALVLALVVLAVTLAVAVARPHRIPESLAAVGGAILLLVLGAMSAGAARAALGDLGSTVAFLAALLIIGEGCRRHGVFDLLAHRLGAGARGRPRRLFALAFAAAVGVTVVLGLDATVVLLTPILLATASRLRLSARPSAYACAHLANSASLLLPVSNLTNLLAFHAARVSFIRFAALMALPFAVAVAVEWAALQRFFAAELAAGPQAGGHTVPALDPAGPAPARETRYALVVLTLTLVAFAVSSLPGIAPLWIAVGGAALIALPSVARGGLPVAGAYVRAAQPGFLAFVFGLGVIVRAAADHGLHEAVVDLLPAGSTLPDLLLIATVSAVLANLVNNLPATLILIPVAGALGIGPLLAVLVGVNVGPNLTYGGSLATLLWRRIIHPGAVRVSLAEFTRLGVVSVVPGLALATTAVWASVRLVG
jgi:arsenical pump membrane protein